MGQKLKEEDPFYLEENANYPPDEGNVLLFKSTYGLKPGCIGSVDQHGQNWVATINWFYDQETDSDALCVYQGASRADAILSLWDARDNAI